MNKLLWIVGEKGIVSQALQKILRERNISFVASSRERCDVKDLGQVRAFSEQYPFTHIINCSAYTAVDKAEKEPEEAFAVNLQGVIHLSEVANNKKLVHFSTDYVFDGKEKTPYVEEDLTSPLNVYGKSKEAAEIFLLKQLPSSLIIRPSWVFSEVGQSFVRAVVKLMLREKEITVVTDQIGKATYAKDLVEAVLEMVDQEGLFHYANKGVISRYEYAQIILQELRVLGAPVVCQKIHAAVTSPKKEIALRPSYSSLETKKIERFLKKPLRHYQSALRECLPKILEQELIYV